MAPRSSTFTAQTSSTLERLQVAPSFWTTPASRSAICFLIRSPTSSQRPLSIFFPQHDRCSAPFSVQRVQAPAVGAFTLMVQAFWCKVHIDCPKCCDLPLYMGLLACGLKSGLSSLLMSTSSRSLQVALPDSAFTPRAAPVQSQFILGMLLGDLCLSSDSLANPAVQ